MPKGHSPVAAQLLMSGKLAHRCDEIHGAAHTLVAARIPRADLAEYKISVCREGELFHVIFVDKERPKGMRGSGGRPGCPGFELTLAADLAVTEAHFIR